MADLASSYLGGLAAGREIAQVGVDAFKSARTYRNKLAQQAQAHDDASKALKVEADKYATAQTEKKDAATVDIMQFNRKENEAERHNKAVEGEWAPGSRGSASGKNIPSELKAAMDTREGYRKTISAAGERVTPEMNINLDDANERVTRVAKRLDFDLGAGDAEENASFQRKSEAIKAQAVARDKEDSYNAELKIAHPWDWYQHNFGGGKDSPKTRTLEANDGSGKTIVQTQDSTGKWK